MLFVSHDRRFLAALSNRVLELTPDGVHNYGGGYTEYVARTGHEAPACTSEARAPPPCQPALRQAWKAGSTKFNAKREKRR